MPISASSMSLYLAWLALTLSPSLPCRVKQYTHQLPATREAFDQELLALYTESGAVLTVPKLQVRPPWLVPFLSA